MIRRGFTLLETLVAIAIFALIGLAAFSVENSVLNSDEESQQRFEALKQLQRAMLTIEQDFNQLTPRGMRLDANSDASSGIMVGNDAFESTSGSIAFVHGGRYNPGLMLARSTLQPVIYRVFDRQLQRLSSNYVDNVIGYEPKVKTLLPAVDEFDVVVIDKDNKEHSDWNASEWPRALKITIKSDTFGTIERLFTLVDPLP